MAPKKEIRAYGIRVFLSPHPEIRRLKYDYRPEAHGTKLWPSSWVLMDYLSNIGIKSRSRVMDLGCGWGLAGIYCAKKFGALVTGVDSDPEVFPFLNLHAEKNGVRIATLKRDFDGLRQRDLEATDLIIGSDICFWDTMVEPLRKLILRALRSGVRLILIADPGRTPFDEVCAYMERKRKGQILEWSTRRPSKISSRILRIEGQGI